MTNLKKAYLSNERRILADWELVSQKGQSLAIKITMVFFLIMPRKGIVLNILRTQTVSSVTKNIVGVPAAMLCIHRRLGKWIPASASLITKKGEQTTSSISPGLPTSSGRPGESVKENDDPLKLIMYAHKLIFCYSLWIFS